MPHFTSTYTVPFNPVHNDSGELTRTQEKYNHHRFVKKRGSRTTPYLSFVDVYQRSSRTFVEADPFDDIFLADFVDANKRQESYLEPFDSVLI